MVQGQLYLCLTFFKDGRKGQHCDPQCFRMSILYDPATYSSGMVFNKNINRSWLLPHLNCLEIITQRLTCLADPLHIAIQLTFQLLLPSQLEECLSVLHLLPLLGKLPGESKDHKTSCYCADLTHYLHCISPNAE